MSHFEMFLIWTAICGLSCLVVLLNHRVDRLEKKS